MLENQNVVTVDVVGDSVTHGLDHCTEEETYTAQFSKMIAEKFGYASVFRYDGIQGTGISPMKMFSAPVCVSKGSGEKRIDIIKNGIGGNTVRRAINRIGDFTGVLANGKSADITFFMFGINDALKSDPKKYVTPERFYDDYKELLTLFKKSEKSEIVIMSATTNDQCIDEHVKAAERLAKENGLIYIDQNGVWNRHYDKNAEHFGQGDWLSDTPTDACHPSPKGAKAIAGEMMKYIV